GAGARQPARRQGERRTGQERRGAGGQGERAMNFGLDATTAATVWATISLVIFLGICVYFGVPKLITKLLDDHIKNIETELAETERLRSKTKALLAEYESKRENAEKEAEDIVASAREEAF